MNQSTIRKMSDRKRPHVKLAGEDGNAFAILARVREAMREVGWTSRNRRIDGLNDERRL